MYFTPEQVEELMSAYSLIKPKYESIVLKTLPFKLNNNESAEYLHHGLLRRLSTLQRCIFNVYNIYPLNKEEKPSDDELTDIAINLQAFIFNLFGCLDNLAWILVKEKNIINLKGEPLTKFEVSLNNKSVKEPLSNTTKEYLNSEKHKDWIEHLENFRHALAHRIPLYVPPCIMNDKEAKKHEEYQSKKWGLIESQRFEELEVLEAKQDALGKFVPWMKHSFSEKSKNVAFHGKMLEDWATIIKISEMILKDIGVDIAI